jgi:thiol-disulfide isomerase/thioredoxin
MAAIWHKRPTTDLATSLDRLLKMFRRFFAIFLLAVLASLCVFAPPAGAMAEDAVFVPVSPPREMAPFRFVDEKGVEHGLTEFRGHYVLLNLWASWCVPCVSEMPALNNLSKTYDSGKLQVLALSEDREGVSVIRPFFTRHSIDNLAVYADPNGRAPFILQVHGLPTTILVNPDGFEVARLEGPADWSKDDIISFLRARTAQKN